MIRPTEESVRSVIAGLDDLIMSNLKGVATEQYSLAQTPMTWTTALSTERYELPICAGCATNLKTFAPGWCDGKL